MTDDEQRELEQTITRHRRELEVILELSHEQWLSRLCIEQDRHFHAMTKLLLHIRKRRELIRQ